MVLSAFWRRLDTPGHDAARSMQITSGWRLEGAAVFRHEFGLPARVEYSITCDRTWHTRFGVLHGWIGEQDWDVRIDHDDNGKWHLNGTAVTGLDDCMDLDLGFTPATNFLQLRRVALQVGDRAEFPVAWIDLPQATLVRLPQRYHRRDAMTYWYESPSVNYAGLLVLAESGFVREYPGLWLLDE
jgi:uncharacterized protein